MKPTNPPKKYDDMKRKQPALLAAYEAFGKACEEAGPLTSRERRLVKIALAFAAHMEGASHAAVRKGFDAGLSREEMQHVAFLAMSTMGFSNGMKFLGWVDDISLNA